MKACILGVSGPELLASEAELLREGRPAGVILFGRNVQHPAQLARLTAALRDVLPVGAVLMVDQEGGRVARLKPPFWVAHPPARLIGGLHARDATAGRRAAWLTGALIGLDCAAAGLDVVTAPVLDRWVPGAHDVIGDRAYASDPYAVATLAGAMAEGLQAAGVQPVGKHAPGHGRAGVDSHRSLPELDDVVADDLLAFAANAWLPWMMTAHLRFRALDDAPATLSARVVGDVIRGRIGFDGVLVSDDLAMQALTGTPIERARAALAAGCDIALYCPGDHIGNAALLTGLPALTPLARERLARALVRDVTPLSRPELLAERQELVDDASPGASPLDPTKV